MVDPFTYALREQILPIISNRLQDCYMHSANRKQTTCAKMPNIEARHITGRERKYHTKIGQRERERRTVAYKQKQWFTSNVVYQIQQQKISNTQFVWSEQLSPILLSHFVNPWRASPRETTLSQNTIHLPQI